MRVLGIDPGTWKTGVGIIETQGSRYHLVHESVIAVKGNPPLEKRLLQIYQGVTACIREHKPEVLALENVFYGKDLQAMVKIGEARSCAMLAAAEQNIEVLEYPPARVKQAVSGNGRATKEQVQQMIKTLLGLKEAPKADSADALAVAICHVHAGNRNRIESQGKRKITWESKLKLALKK